MNLQYHIQLLCTIMAETRSKYFCLDAQQRSAKPTPDKWSKKEILGHLVDSARYNLQRFTEIMITDGIYSVKSYDQHNLVRINDYQHMDNYELLTLWQILNKRIVRTLETMDDHHLDKQILSGNEPFTLAWLVNDYMVHLQHHLNQIFNEEGHTSVPVIVNKADALEKLLRHFVDTNSEFISLLIFADLEVELYKPHLSDRQKPHLKDEVYIIASGSGEFCIEGKTLPFEAGDVLYTKAGDDHRFIHFTDDFTTWVIFYGIELNSQN